MAADQAKALAALAGGEAARGNFPAALELMSRAVQADPSQADTHFRLGLLQHAVQQDLAALKSFDAAIALGGANPVLHNVRGMACKRLGRLEEALADYDAAVRLRPDFFEALNNRGVAQRHLGLQEDAARSFRAAIAVRPQASAMHNQLGIVLHQLGRYGDAADAFERALELDPLASDAAMNLGLARQELRQFDAALDSMHTALSLAPENLDVQANLGNLLLDMGRLEEALPWLEAVAGERPKDGEALMNHANALRDLWRIDEALDRYAQAADCKPGDAAIAWNESLCRLTAGDYARGWPLYERRWQASALGIVPREFAAPQWTGQAPLAGRTILLHAEQGLGDTMQMCRFARAVKARGATVLLEVQPALMGLLRGLEGVDVLLRRGEALPPFDFHCPLFSVPLALGFDAAAIAQEITRGGAYLPLPDPARREKWRAAIGARDRLQVGLAWSGNPGHRMNHRRSLPVAALLAALPEGPRYWSLQENLQPGEQQLLEPAGPLSCFADTGFLDTAAQMCELDLVITVDTSIAHLAGGLGQRTWVLLSTPADWRWGMEQERCVWYPAMRLLRQARSGDWNSVLNQLSGAVAALAYR